VRRARLAREKKLFSFSTLSDLTPIFHIIARSERLRELDGFVGRLRGLYDEDGQPLVDFPTDFDEVVGTLSLEQIVSALPWTEAIFSARRGDGGGYSDDAAFIPGCLCR
jgi:hypothetical protein